MTLAPPFIPHSELVCRAWLFGVPGVPGVAAELPADQQSWAADGFVTFLGLGGAPTVDLPVRRPVFQIDTWAVSPTSNKAPWGKANQLAELIVAATLPPAAASWGIRGVDAGTNYAGARVLAAEAKSEPRRVFADAGGYARFTFELQLTYVAVPS